MPSEFSMKPSDRQARNAELRKKIIGFGEKSFRKSYYPELQMKLEDLERYKTLLDQSNDAIFLMEVPTGRFLDVSESACRQIGYTEEECTTKTMYDLVPDKEELYKIFSGKVETLVIDTILRKSCDDKVPYEVNMRRVRFGNKDYVVAIARDISQRKQAEKELLEAKTQAELYLDIMGHDINNINQTVMGFLEIADTKLHETGKLGIEDSELLTRPIESLKNSAKLIENLRKIQKERSHVYKIEPVSINRVIEEVVKQFSPIAGRDVKIGFRPESDCYVLANPLLKDVFSNLLGNAIKHSKGPLTINISTTLIRVQGKLCCRTSIEDNGPGIPDKRKASLFDFSKAFRQKIAGKGLGLYLVKTLVDDFHGKVRVEDRVPGDHTKGAKFVVLLPVIKK